MAEHKISEKDVFVGRVPGQQENIFYAGRPWVDHGARIKGVGRLARFLGTFYPDQVPNGICYVDVSESMQQAIRAKFKQHPSPNTKEVSPIPIEVLV
ncbi:hypothetical protein HYS93_00765 [Candidatus Daviesbacteria bacterium]|nr:hypothetical protein [Candidatus Daviesbacteria bacterium]